MTKRTFLFCNTCDDSDLLKFCLHCAGRHHDGHDLTIAPPTSENGVCRYCHSAGDGRGELRSPQREHPTANSNVGRPFHLHTIGNINAVLASRSNRHNDRKRSRYGRVGKPAEQVPVFLGSLTDDSRSLHSELTSSSQPGRTNSELTDDTDDEGAVVIFSKYEYGADGEEHGWAKGRRKRAVAGDGVVNYKGSPKKTHREGPRSATSPMGEPVVTRTIT